eukprot:15398735-Alexandrium_andersonii.AAC.1
MNTPRTKHRTTCDLPNTDHRNDPPPAHDRTPKRRTRATIAKADMALTMAAVVPGSAVVALAVGVA